MKKVSLVLMSLLLSAALVGCGGNQAANNEKPQDKPEPAPAQVSLEGETDPAVWGEQYPAQYESWMKNAEGGLEPSKYGGSEKTPKKDHEPEIQELFKGMGFSKDYNEDRGHYYALEDQLNSGRISDKLPASCLACKSADYPKRKAELGDAFYNIPLVEEVKAVSHKNLSCSDCHDPKTMELVITREPLVIALNSMGIDVTKATQKEMATYVCAQCHVEYYFAKDTRKVTFPWANGTEPEDFIKYYETVIPEFKDWEHPDSLAPMVKMQHPEFETWRSGVHGKMGVSCADCHLPKMKDAEGKEFSSHWMTSPLKHIEDSCTKCHADTSALKDRVFGIQDKTMELQTKAGNKTVEAHAAIKAAIEKGAKEDKLADARKALVRAQIMWDYVAAENGRGFHNAAQAERALNQAIVYAEEAIQLAKAAAK